MINWDYDIELKGFCSDDLKVEIEEIDEEKSFVIVSVYYDYLHADYWDTYCVDYETGKCLNHFMPEDFDIINIEEGE